MKRVLKIAMLVVAIVLVCGGMASAGVRANDFEFKNSIFTGYVLDGEANVAMLETISVFEPEGEELFGVPLTKARYKVVLFDGVDVVDDLLLVGNIGNSRWFKLTYRLIDEPINVNAGGVLYNASQHFDEDLPPIYVGFYVTDNGNIMYTLEMEIEIDPGYFLGADVYMIMESLLNPDAREGKLWGKHNFEEDGSLYGEIFVYNIAGSTYVGGGIGFTF